METIAELEQLGYDTLLPKHGDYDEHDADKDHKTKTERSFKIVMTKQFATVNR